MPLVPGALNLAWELCSCLSAFTIGHLIWLLLDFAIFGFNYRAVESFRNRSAYGLATLLAFVLMRLLFGATSFNGMLVSSFLIDIPIAGFYLFEARNISRRYLFSITLLRTLGDFAAWIVYAADSIVVQVVGPVVFILNLLFIATTFELQARKARA